MPDVEVCKGDAVAVDDLVTKAEALSATLVAPLGRRWAHVQQVAVRARELVPAVPTEDRTVLIAAAWLHDVGYSAQIAKTGFHALDGARLLADEGWPPVVVQLVAHHTGAWSEAVERGLSAELGEFPRPPAELLDALTTADMTTGPDGVPLRAEERLVEILSRYGPESPVHRAVTRSAPELLAAVRRVDQRLRQALAD